jgi:hypothetical protein
MNRLYYLINQNYSAYYDQAGNLIAENYTDLLLWFQTLNLIESAFDVQGYQNVTCPVYKICVVTGSASIPAYIHGGAYTPDSRIYGVRLDLFNPDYSKLCNNFQFSSFGPTPVIGSPYIVSATCATPVIGSPYVVQTNAVYSVNDASPWIVNQDVSSSSKAGSVVNLTFESMKTGQSGYIQGAVVANLNAAVWPSSTVILDNSNQAQIPAGVTIQIGTDGTIRWSGYANVGSDTVAISNLIYTL